MTPHELIVRAYAEDLPAGDLTTDHLQIATRPGTARLVAKEDLVLSGSALFSDCVRFIAPNTDLNWQFKDSALILNRQTVCWLRGDLIALLKAERVALNFLGRLSGIATLTRCFAEEAKGTKCRILDTRKTTPLLRALEKQAVVDGGGQNHRMNLSDAVLIKENHIRAAGSLSEAVRKIRVAYAGPVEVECSSLAEVEMALKENVQRILLDNMNDEEIRACRAVIPLSVQVEASGNMNLKRIRAVAELGVDFISVGALTHSAPTADFSLLFEWGGPP